MSLLLQFLNNGGQLINITTQNDIEVRILSLFICWLSNVVDIVMLNWCCDVSSE